MGRPANSASSVSSTDALGADGIDRVIQPDEQPFQVVLAGLLDLTALDVDVVEHEFLAPDQTRQIESERRDVALQLRGRLLESHEHARLAELRGAAHEKLRGEQRLAAPRAAADQRGPPARQSTARDFVETLDARGALGQLSSPGSRMSEPLFFIARAILIVSTAWHYKH